MSSRTQGGARGAHGVEEDDWFASTPPPTVERESTPWEPEPESESEWRSPDPPHPDYSKRRAAVVLAAVIGIALLVGGILAGRATTSAVTETVTVTATVTEQETAAATTSSADTTTTPTTSTPDTSTTTTTTPSTTTTPTGSGAVPTEATLRPGTTGSSSVVALQTALTTLGYEPGAADGTYGPSTVTAVSAFQTDNDLKVDGIAGPATIAAINAAVASG